MTSKYYNKTDEGSYKMAKCTASRNPQQQGEHKNGTNNIGFHKLN